MFLTSEKQRRFNVDVLKHDI